MQALDIPPTLLVPSVRDGKPEHGVFSFIVRHPDVVAMLRERYGRDGLCLKVFRGEMRPLSEFCWSDATGVLLTDCTVAQNLFARHGFAPRVYDIVSVNGTNWAQVTDYVIPNGKTFDRAACKEQVVKRYGIRCVGGDMNKANWVGAQMVDFQAHRVGPGYFEGLYERVCKNTAWGSSSKPYQGLGVLIWDSQRDTEHRLQVMRWNEYDWKGKTVLDLGCNLGAMCIEANFYGAKRITGIDLPHVADVAHETANWTHQWNIDYLGLQLPRDKDQIPGTFDVVLCLSVKQLKPVPWAFDLCREVCYFEGHVPDREETWRPVLEQHFACVEFLGATTDHGVRPLFRCWK